MATLLPQSENIELANGSLLWVHQFYDLETSESLYQQLLQQLNWQQDELTIAGKRRPIPRLQAWYGNHAYSYSGIQLTQNRWHPVLLTIKEAIEQFSHHSFNSLLANLYRDENDSVGWHADDEAELGTNPVIASLSLGAARPFHLKHKRLQEQRLKMLLEPGDLVIMSGALQHHWRHQLPKLKAHCKPRINLTFRLLY